MGFIFSGLLSILVKGVSGMKNLTNNSDEFEHGNMFSKESWELKTRDDFVFAAAIVMNDLYNGYLDDSSANRSEWYGIILYQLVQAHQRDYDNNHRATAPSGYVSRFLSGRITRDESLTLHEKISYRGRVSGRAYARRQSPCHNLSFD